MDFIEKTINDGLDMLQIHHMDMPHEEKESQSLPIKEEEDSTFISNLVGEVRANILEVLL